MLRNDYFAGGLVGHCSEAIFITPWRPIPERLKTFAFYFCRALHQLLTGDARPPHQNANANATIATANNNVRNRNRSRRRIRDVLIRLTPVRESTARTETPECPQSYHRVQVVLVGHDDMADRASTSGRFPLFHFQLEPTRDSNGLGSR